MEPKAALALGFYPLGFERIIQGSDQRVLQPVFFQNQFAFEFDFLVPRAVGGFDGAITGLEIEREAKAILVRRKQLILPFGRYAADAETIAVIQRAAGGLRIPDVKIIVVQIERTLQAIG